MTVKDLPKDLVSRAWQGVESATTDALLVELKLRTLAAAARSDESSLILMQSKNMIPASTVNTGRFAFVLAQGCHVMQQNIFAFGCWA